LTAPPPHIIQNSMVNTSLRGDSGVRLRGKIGKAAIATTLLAAIPFRVHAEVPLKQPCAQASETVSTTRPPTIFLGLSIDFEARILEAFPIGSREDQLLFWLDSRGFNEASVGYTYTAFTDSADEFSRSNARRDAGQTINLRTLKVWAPIGNSHFSVAWNSDECGNLIEVFGDTELFQFDMP
jgi:hypothetical protein